MDDIDRAKIGKKDEPLRGWDHIRKPKMGTNYPPMRARGAKKHPSYFPSFFSDGGWWILFLFAFIVITSLLILQMVFQFW